jgi:ABC-2 type transport system permease protein
LKARLTVNRIKTARGGPAYAVISAVVGSMFAIVVALLAAFSAASSDPRVHRGVLVLGATVLLLAWSVLPLVTFGTDETLDPARLQLLPLAPRSLMRGMLASSFVGIAPMGAVVVVTGAVIGYGAGPWFVISLVDGVALLLLCAASARTLTTVLASRLTSRRGRDAMVIVVSFLAIAVQGLRFVRFASVDPDLVDTTANVLRWLPPGMLGHAMLDARDGLYAVAVLETLAPAALIPVLLVVWGRALDRALTVVTGGLTVRRRDERREGTTMALLFDRLPFITPTPIGAVAARELRYVARDPRRKVHLLNSIMLGVGIPVFVVVRGGSDPSVVLLSTIGGYIAILAAMNQFGVDGPALWMDVAAGNRLREAIVGKNLALTVQVVPVMLVAGLLLAAFTGGWAYLPAALAIGISGLGAGLAVANVVSVRYPQRVPETRNPFGGGGAGQGCGVALVFMVCSLVQQVAVVPLVIVGVVIAVAGPVVGLVLSPVVVLYGYLLWRTGVGMAVRWGFWRQPELLTAVDPRRSG